jgi:arylsulfatase A-like enzyme
VQRLFPVGTPRSLHPLLREREAQGHGKMVRTERWKYTYDVLDAGDEELYNLLDDPWELTNLAREAQHLPVIAEMRRLLAEWMLRSENGRPVPLYFRPFWEGETPRDVAPPPDDGPLFAR